MANEVTAPISKMRIQECIASARFWASELGSYGQSMRDRANFWALVSTILSTLAGLAVWAKVAASTDPLAIFVVGAAAIIAALATAIPQIIGYGACAQVAKSLSTRYGRALGKLTDALDALENDPVGAQPFAHKAVEEFESVKEAKDGLESFPTILQNKINAIREKRDGKPTNVASPTPTI